MSKPVKKRYRALESLVCAHCGRELGLEGLKKHCKIKHPGLPISASCTVPSKAIECPNCEMSFRNNIALGVHRKMTHGISAAASIITVVPAVVATVVGDDKAVAPVLASAPAKTKKKTKRKADLIDASKVGKKTKPAVDKKLKQFLADFTVKPESKVQEWMEQLAAEDIETMEDVKMVGEKIIDKMAIGAMLKTALIHLCER